MARLKSRINPQLSRLISRLIVLSTCVLNLQIPSNGPLCEVLSTLGTAKKVVLDLEIEVVLSVKQDQT